MSARRRPWPRPRPCSSVKVPETRPGAPRLYTIPPSAPFLTTLARTILAGDLPSPGGTAPDPLTLPFTTIYLPTRRAARALREAFLAEAKSDALLLPRIRTLGDPDEEAALILDAEDRQEDDAAPDAAAIGALPRRVDRRPHGPDLHVRSEFDAHLVVGDGFHFADEAARRDDDVAALQIGDHLHVPLPRLLLRPDQQKVEDHEYEDERQHLHDDASRRIAASGLRVSI